MAIKYLDATGLAYFWSKIKDYVDSQSSGADHVIETGTSGDWTYQKWSSGLLKAWYSESKSFAATTSSGNGWFRTSGQQIITIPSDLGFTSVTYGSVSITGIAQAYWFASVTTFSTSQLLYYAVHLGSTTQTGYARAEVVGRWK